MPVNGRFGVPSDVAAVTANVTVRGADADGFVTVYPCGQAPPWASNLNYAEATTVANLVTVQLGSGAFCVYSTSAVHVVVDLLGWFGPGAPIVASTPARLADTRPGAFTVDGLGAGGARPRCSR